MQGNTASNPPLAAKLRRLFATAKMPTNPALAANILKLINDPKSNTADFAAVIRTDPALATRLLKTANSVEFAQRTPATTTARAITVLGLNRVKTVSLGFQLVAHLDRLGGTPFDMKTFWQHSLLRACLMRAIAQQVVPARQEEAFLIGLLQESGIPLLVQIHGCSYGNLYRSANLSPTAFYAVEKESFSHTHVDAIAAMASEWRLPKIIGVPLGRHHERIKLAEKPAEADWLAAVSYFVGGLHFAEGLTVDPDEESLQEYGSAALGLDEEAWAQAQQAAANEYQQVSSLYGDVVPEDVDVAELLGEANHQLASVASDAHQRVLDVQAERTTIQQEQRGLENALREYRERAALDPLTNVLNRGALTEATRKAIEQNADQGTPVGVFFLDLDNFKRLNDTYGHSAGDKVLKAVAALLIRETGGSGTVGRYGGEEFVVVLLGLSVDATRELGERIVASVRVLDAESIGVSGPITCSLGAVWGDHLPIKSAEELFAAGDERMYRAKRSGKDRCVFELLAEPRATDAAPADAGTNQTDAALAETGAGEDGSALLEEMLEIAGRLNESEVDTFAGIRKQERKQITTACAVHYFTGSGAELRSEQAATRNVSTGGVGLLLGRPLARGEAVEVVLNRGGSDLFLAGLVAFCRHIMGSIHEVGVQFVAHSVTPIICADAAEALQKLDWVARAVDAKRDGVLEPQMFG